MECYLDNSATTRCLDSAAALMAGILCTDYGNPSSLHHKGVQAEEYVRCSVCKCTAGQASDYDID